MIIYISLCSVIFSVWEEWDYFTAFYFFFISLSTIGLGDEIPQQPHYACLFFIFFVVGLALVSMCISIMQVRVENKYMAALMLIDEEYKTGIINVGDPENVSTPMVESTNTTPSIDQRFSTNHPLTIVGAGNNNPGAVKWRRPMLNFQLHATTDEPRNYEETSDVFPEQHTPKTPDSDFAPRSPIYRMRSTSTLSGRSSIIMTTPPVLSALLSRRTSTKRLKEHALLRVDSINSHSEKFEKPDTSPRSMK